MLLTLVTLLAATPHAPDDGDVLYVPRLEALSTLGPFLDLAGTRSVLLRRDSWRDDAHPLLRVDLTRAESIKDSGLDPKGPYTAFALDDATVACAELADEARFTARAMERLASLGTVTTRTDKGGLKTVLAADAIGRALGAYLQKGKTVCAVRSAGGHAERVLGALAPLLTHAPAGSHWKRAQALPGVAALLTRYGVAAASARPLVATIEARTAALPLSRLRGPGATPFPARLPGLLTVRARVEPPDAVVEAQQLSRRLARLMPKNLAPLEAATAALAPLLTGNVLLFVKDVKVKGSLKTPSGRFFSLHAVVLAEVNDGALAAKALAPLAGLEGAQALPQGQGVSLLAPDGELTLGLRGNTLFVASDGPTRELALAAAAGPAQLHGLEATLEPAALAKALAQVPLLEAVSSPELAGVLAASTELGPLLGISELVTGWADSEGQGHHAALTWALKAPAPLPAPDAGP